MNVKPISLEFQISTLKTIKDAYYRFSTKFHNQGLSQVSAFLNLEFDYLIMECQHGDFINFSNGVKEINKRIFDYEYFIEEKNKVFFKELKNLLGKLISTTENVDSPRAIFSQLIDFYYLLFQSIDYLVNGESEKTTETTKEVTIKT